MKSFHAKQKAGDTPAFLLCSSVMGGSNFSSLYNNVLTIKF